MPKEPSDRSKWDFDAESMVVINRIEMINQIKARLAIYPIDSCQIHKHLKIVIGVFFQVGEYIGDFFNRNHHYYVTLVNITLSDLIGEML